MCGSTSGTAFTLHGLEMVQCLECGIMRQHVRMAPQDLGEWYARQYFEGIYTHTYEHDVAVANMRLDAYRFTGDGMRLLDVGCGNGAFVAQARARGIDAWGQDLAESSLSPQVYVGSLEGVAFPTDSFDVITLHDVLEHHLNPLELLREVKRLLRRPGKLIVDFPRFFHQSGVHHWKPVEHLWMLSEAELHALLHKAGFTVTATTHPLESKVVIEAEKRPVARTQILVPAGIGDAYWVLTKLPGFLRDQCLAGIPDVWVQDSGGPKRTQPFLRTIPTIHAAGYRPLASNSKLFHEAYEMDARTVFPDVLGVDYFMAYNGVLRAGRSLEEVDPEYGCQWEIPRMFISKAAMEYRDRLRAQGPYILTYYAEAGMYRKWLREFPAPQIADMLRYLAKDTGASIVFMGAAWDRGQVGREIAEMDSAFVDLIGCTSYDQMLGAILGATAVVGFPAGNTILAAVLGIPTILFWNQYFNPKFWKYSCPPNAPYIAMDTANVSAVQVQKAFYEVCSLARELKHAVR